MGRGSIGKPEMGLCQKRISLSPARRPGKKYRAKWGNTRGQSWSKNPFRKREGVQTIGSNDREGRRKRRLGETGKDELLGQQKKSCGRIISGEVKHRKSKRTFNGGGAVFSVIQRLSKFL